MHLLAFANLHGATIGRTWPILVLAALAVAGLLLYGRYSRRNRR